MTDSQELPAPIQDMITKAQAAVEAHPYHDLLPYYRAELYRLLDALTDVDGKQVRGWWAYYTGKHVEAQWTQSYRNHATDMLQLAAAVLNGNVTHEAAEARLVADLNQMEKEAYFLEYDGVNNPTATEAYYLAMHRVVYEAMGENYLDGVLLSPDDKDSVLDIYCTDAAGDASFSYAMILPGNVGLTDDITDEIDIDPAKQKAFWFWWLDTGIKQAWAKVVTD